MIIQTAVYGNVYTILTWPFLTATHWHKIENVNYAENNNTVLLTIRICKRLTTNGAWQAAVPNKWAPEKSKKIKILKSHALPLTRPVQETYQTSPYQTLILLHRHISSFSKEWLINKATERGSNWRNTHSYRSVSKGGNNVKLLSAEGKTKLTECRGQPGAECHQHHKIHGTCWSETKRHRAC